MNLVLKHYTKLKPMNCTVLSGDINKLVTVRFDDIEGKDINFIKGDPVILGILGYEEELQIYGGRVIAITPHGDNFLICSQKVNARSEELRRRVFFRYPASLLADVKLIGACKWEDACIIDISYSGMRIYSTGNFDIGSIIELNIFLSNNISKFEAVIVRKTKSFKRNEYGIQIVSNEKNNIYDIQKKFFNILEDETALVYKHLLDYNFKCSS